MFKKAFTLSEVLIVIAVIGIASALTIPNVIDSYKDEHTVAKLQKVYGELQTGLAQTSMKYADYIESWNGVTTDEYKEMKRRMIEFLDVSQTDAPKPCNFFDGDVNVELKDGTFISIYDEAQTDGLIYVGTDGKNSTTKGKNIFCFRYTINSSRSDITIVPCGQTYGRKANNDFYYDYDGRYGNQEVMGTAWALTNGNLDYLKCAESLNWETKTTCD